MTTATLIKRLERIERELHEVREGLAVEPAEAADVELDGPVVDASRRVLEYRGVVVPLSVTQVKLASLLLRHAGVELPFEIIDGDICPPDADWSTADSIRQRVSRFKRRLREGGLPELADALKAGTYQTYIWYPVWSSQEMTNCHADGHNHEIHSEEKGKQS